MSMKTTLRAGEDLQVECKGHVPIDSGFINLQSKPPSNSEIVETTRSFNASSEQITPNCRRDTTNNYIFSSENLVNNTVYQCVVGNAILDDTETSATKTIIIKPIGN